MNDLIEAINYSQGSYWGDERFKFRTSIAEFSDATEVPTDGDRIVKLHLIWNYMDILYQIV